MSTNGKIKVKYIGEDGKYGFVFGETYDAYKIKSDFPHKSDFLGVVHKDGEEYLHPKKWFEIVEEY
jgi:hypothetical protein